MNVDLCAGMADPQAADHLLNVAQDIVIAGSLSQIADASRNVDRIRSSFVKAVEPLQNIGSAVARNALIQLKSISRKLLDRKLLSQRITQQHRQLGWPLPVCDCFGLVVQQLHPVGAVWLPRRPRPECLKAVGRQAGVEFASLECCQSLHVALGLCGGTGQSLGK